MGLQDIPAVKYIGERGSYKLVSGLDSIPKLKEDEEYVMINKASDEPTKLFSDSNDMDRFYWKLPYFPSGTVLSIYKRKTSWVMAEDEEFIMKIKVMKS
jgi:hypothetical protein